MLAKWRFLLLAVLGLIAFVNSFGAQASENRKIRVAIVGAGNAGAAAAYYLSKAKVEGVEFEIKVFESGDRIGGRSFSKVVRLSDGSEVTIDLGTQMNFKEFLNVLPAEIKQTLANDFVHPPQNIATVANAGSILVLLPRILNPDDFTEVQEKALQVEGSGILGIEEMGLGGVASANLREEFLRSAPFDDLTAYLKHPRLDKISAYDFLKGLSYQLQPTVTMRNPWSWFSVAPKMYSFATSTDAERIALGREALVNLLYARGYRKANFSDNYVRRMIESMEKIVEFSDLHSMSALNFLWQLKWAIEGGPILSMKNGWNKVSEAFLAALPKDHILLNHRVKKISPRADGTYVLSIKKMGTAKLLQHEADIVINTADTDVALTMYSDPPPALKALLEANEYSTTIAILFETDTPVARILGRTSALSSETGLFKKIGGLTFQSELTGHPKNGAEVAGAFIQTEAARELLRLAKASKWSEAELTAATRQVVIEDLRGVRNGRVSQIADSIERGRVLSTFTWEKALPLFKPGYVQLVSNYRQELDGPKLATNIYAGQAVDGRSIAMVIPGAKRLVSRLIAGLSSRSVQADGECGEALVP